MDGERSLLTPFISFSTFFSVVLLRSDSVSGPPDLSDFPTKPRLTILALDCLRSRTLVSCQSLTGILTHHLTFSAIQLPNLYLPTFVVFCKFLTGPMNESDGGVALQFRPGRTDGLTAVTELAGLSVKLVQCSVTCLFKAFHLGRRLVGIELEGLLPQGLCQEP